MRRAALLAVMTWAAAARADGIDVPVGARAVGRAGVGVLSTDDGAALWYNPAGMARRSTLRAQAGVSLANSTADFASDTPFSPAAPTVHDRAPATLLPWGGVEVPLGDSLVVGAAFFAPSQASFAYPTAPAAYVATADDRARYPQRYAASSLGLRRQGGGGGIAWRPLPWLAVGASFLAFDVSLDEGRTLWAGTTPTSLAQLDPSYDLAFAASGADHFVPAATAGAVIAPVDLPVELGASVAWSADAHVTGAPALSASRGATMDGAPLVAAQVDAGAGARLDLPLPLVVRGAARYLLPRAAFELDGELDVVSHAAPAWTVDGVSVTPQGGAPVAITSVALGPTFQSRWALRAAADVIVIPGVVTLLGGYAFSRRGVSAASVGPGLPDLDSHTVALGVEAHAGEVLVSLGVSRSFTPAVRAGDAVQVVAPLAPAGLSLAALSGTQQAGGTVVALDVELELP